MDKPGTFYPVILAAQQPVTLQELYTNALRWTKNDNARNGQGTAVCIRAPGAVRWCINGAIELIYGAANAQSVHEKLLAVINKDKALFSSLVAWNDDKARTFKDVRTLIVAANV